MWARLVTSIFVRVIGIGAPSVPMGIRAPCPQFPTPLPRKLSRPWKKLRLFSGRVATHFSKSSRNMQPSAWRYRGEHDEHHHYRFRPRRACCGRVIGWLWASREAAGAKQTVENLRLQLNEVVQERDSNRTAAQEWRRSRRDRKSANGLSSSRLPRSRKRRKVFRPSSMKWAASSWARRASSSWSRPKAGSRRRCSRSRTSSSAMKRAAASRERARRSLCRLREAVELVRTGQGQVRDETRHLVNALRASPKARGRWGEQSLRNVLEQAGLDRTCRFPDRSFGRDWRLAGFALTFIVRLPGGRNLVIDAKCSLNAYLDACDEVDDEKRQACFRAHVASMRTLPSSSARRPIGRSSAMPPTM